MKLVISARDNTRGAFNKVGAQMRGMHNETTGLNKKLSLFQSSINKLPEPLKNIASALGPLGVAGVAVAAGAAIGLFVSSAIKAFTDFEDSMANVRKTTDMTKEETRALGKEIDTLALRLPVAHGELAKIAAIAGQLGIVGSENILNFTEDVAKMVTAFDMDAESVAIAMAKLANIYDIPIEKTSNLGSAINVLGNTTAASEKQLMAFSMTLGPTGKQLGFAATEVLALGASMIEMGMDSSDAGTRLNRAFSMIGQNLPELAEFMGVSADQFKASFEDMPMETFMDLLKKLSQVEGNLNRNTVASKLFNEVGAKAIKGLTGNLGGLETNLTNVAQGFEENTSLTEEFAAKTDTLKAKFALLDNAAKSFKINVGNAFAPLTGALVGVAQKAITGLSNAFDVLQKISGPVLDALLLKFNVLKAFLEGLFGPVMAALAPLKGMLGDTSGAVSKLNGVFKLMSDVFIIITGIAKKLGTILGTLLAKAITPLIAKIQDGIKTITEFYNKLGPLKDLIGWVEDKASEGARAIGEWADSFEETTPAAGKLGDALNDLGGDATGAESATGKLNDALGALSEEAINLESLLGGSFKTFEQRLTEASGSYKTAIGNITKEIDTLKDAWNIASEDQKGAIEDQITALGGVRDEMGRGEEAAKKNWDTNIKGADEATEKQKEFKIQIGNTTVTFKGMAAEVVKNAEAYANLQKNAEALLDLNWEVFTGLETKLPDIDKGIKSMASSFNGLKRVLEENINSLESVKESVMEISDMAAPFLEAGFLNGVEAIGKFAGALSSAGSAINSFANLQDVSIEGCVKFSLRVHNMVTALEILESQMEDLVPSFGDMDTLIDGIADAFLYGGDKAEGFAAGFEDALNSAYSTLEQSGTNFKTFSEIVDKALDTGKLETWDKFGGSPRWLEDTTKSIREVEQEMIEATREFGLLRVGMDEWDVSGWTGEFNKAAHSMQIWARETYGVELAYEEVYAIMKKTPEEQKKWLDEIMHSEKALTFQMDTQTDALKHQTEQLNKITEALKPYLDFMGTLENIAGMAELSTDDLNAGLEAITSTLSNLGTALTDFNLEGSMDALFGNAEEGEGAATAFINTLTAHMADFSTLTGYIEMLTNSFTSLSSAFASIQEIETTKIAVEKAVGSIIRKVNSLISVIPSMFMYGANAILAFANGMRAYKSVLENELKSIANMIEAYLGVASPTELGPLKSINEWPKNLVKSFAFGIKSEMGTLNNSFSSMTLAAPGGDGGGSRTVITFNVTQNIKDKATADYSTNSLERMLNRHEIM